MEPHEVPALIVLGGGKRRVCQVMGSFRRKNRAGQGCGVMGKTPSSAWGCVSADGASLRPRLSEGTVFQAEEPALQRPSNRRHSGVAGEERAGGIAG